MAKRSNTQPIIEDEVETPEVEQTTETEQTTDETVTEVQPEVRDWTKEFGGVSKAIRAMAAMPEFIDADGKVNRGKIARAFTPAKRYQHVRNVLMAPAKKS